MGAGVGRRAEQRCGHPPFRDAGCGSCAPVRAEADGVRENVEARERSAVSVRWVETDVTGSAPCGRAAPTPIDRPRRDWESGTWGPRRG